MTPDRHDAWDEDAIDRLLADAVQVQPSPDFRARVAAHIDRLPPPRARTPVWAWSGMAAAVILVALASSGLLRLERRTSPLEQPAPEVLQTVRPEPGLAPLVPVQPVVIADRVTAPQGRPQRQPNLARSASSRETASHIGQPALFDLREREAFSWFLRASLADELPLQIERAPAAESETDVFPLAIVAIDVADITVSDQAELLEPDNRF